MTSRLQRALTMGALVSVIFVSFGWLAARGTSLHPAAVVVGRSEEQRLHDLALRDLKETQDEVAKMKAHGIGMHPISDQ